MDCIKDFEEEIYKCSRCGLCQSVCPVYKAALNECAVSKAKFTMLNGIIKGDLKLNDKIKSYMDLCTGCNACKNFCPSGIDARKIFTSVKAEYYKTHKPCFFDSYLVFKTLLMCARMAFPVYRFLGLDKLVKCFDSMLLKTGILGKRVLLMNSLAEKKHSYKGIKRVSKTKAVYFKGCFNQYINSETEEAVKNILESAGIELIEKDFECCGVMYLNDGNLVEFKKLIEKNLAKIDCDYDCILTDCASCNWVLKEYVNYHKSAEKFSSKIVSVVDLMKNLKFEAVQSIKVSAHKPCHEDYDFIEIIKSIKNVEYIEAEDFDKCCGFSGKFALKNSEISREISRKKSLKYFNTKCDKVITTCPACLLGLNQGNIECSKKGKELPEPINLFVFLAEYCRII